MKEDSYRRIMDCSFFGYACHRIILDGEGKPMDYEFVEVNAGFEKITGLKAEAIVNRRITEVLPGIVGDPFDWIGFYGRIALHLTEEEFEQYSEPLGRWYKINAYAPEKFYFTTVLQDITKEREHSEQLDRFFSVNLDLLCIADTSGHFIKVNREWEAILGYSAQELEERTFLEFVHPNDLQGTLAAMAELSGQKPVLQFVNRYRCKDGSYRHIEWRSHPHGSLIYAAARDVTERIRMEEELRRSREMLQSVMDTIPQFIFWKDRNSVYLGCNQNGARIAGVASPEAIVGKTDYDLAWKKEEADFFRECDERVMSSGKAEYHIIEPQLQADGKQAWLNTNKAPLRDREGNVIGILVTFEDITERIRIEDKLAVSEDRFSRAIAGTGAGLWDWDMVENTVYFSPLWKSMLGYEDHEIENDFSGWNKLWHPEDAVRIQKAINDHLEERTTTYEIEHRLRHKDGGWRWILTRGDIHKDTAGKMVRWVGTNIDITERKRAEEKLNEYARQMELNNIELDAALVRAEQAGRAKGEFLANMSHEIRTPMNVMIGLSELLMQTNLSHKQRDYLNKISTSSRMLLGIINDILDYSKIESGKLDLESLDFSLRAMLDDFVAMMSFKAEEKGLELICSAEPDVPDRLTGDPGRLRQVLTNLVGNALKFTEKGEVAIHVSLGADSKLDGSETGEISPVTIQLNNEPHGERHPHFDSNSQDSTDDQSSVTLCFTVRDTGTGIPADKLAGLFESFSQVDTSITRKFGGTGLGLAISKQLAGLMGGEIGVHSREGYGSTFWFTARLGLAVDAAENNGLITRHKVREELTKIADFSNRKARILVAEDNVTNQQVILAMLKKLGLTADAVADGQEAVHAVRTIPYDLILMDVQMPVMDGIEATRRIRELEQTGQTKKCRQDAAPRPCPIIALTAHAMEGYREQCRAAGMDDYLTKPLEPFRLAEVLHKRLPTEEAGDVATESKPDGDEVVSGEDMPSVENKQDAADSNTPSGVLSLPASPLPVLNETDLLERVCSDEEFARSIVQLFLDDSQGRIETLARDLERGDASCAVSQAHTLKGASANIGAEAFCAVAQEMEQAGLDGNLEALRSLQPRLEEEFRRLHRHVDENAPGS